MTIDEAIESLERRYVTISMCPSYEDALAINRPIKLAVDALREKQEAEKNEPCKFCAKFDFGTAREDVDGKWAHIYLAGGTTQFDKKDRFNFCPVCGRRLTHG